MLVKKIEFHIHTRYSKDSFQSKLFLMLKCKLKKIDCIAITDHNEIKGAIKYQPYFLKHKIMVIVGEEIFTKDGEIIGLFLKKKIEPNLSALDTINKIKEQNGLVYIPHPYDEKRAKTVLKYEEIVNNKNSIDMIEIHNGRNIKKEFSQMQQKIADELNLFPIIGSDAHTFLEVGRNYVVLNEKKQITKDNLVNCLKNANYIKKDCINWIHHYTKIVRILKMLMKGDFNGVYQIIKKKCRRRK